MSSNASAVQVGRVLSEGLGDISAEQLAIACLHGIRQEGWGLKQHGTHMHQLKTLFLHPAAFAAVQRCCGRVFQWQAASKFYQEADEAYR